MSPAPFANALGLFVCVGNAPSEMMAALVGRDEMDVESVEEDEELESVPMDTMVVVGRGVVEVVSGVEVESTALEMAALGVPTAAQTALTTAQEEEEGQQPSFH